VLAGERSLHPRFSFSPFDLTVHDLDHFRSTLPEAPPAFVPRATLRPGLSLVIGRFAFLKLNIRAVCGDAYLLWPVGIECEEGSAELYEEKSQVAWKERQ
jgi:hypothetical protein